ncbi:MLN51-like protein [Cardamine amara subsp. amara]|uniref:MLN51-like protein n=1 Tax=Cardamine amara subsp. amara TaxID=228776 RepID=A0ABD1AJV6_CARAN
MAPANDEVESEYESDPEELKRSLATRRREASDDEDEEDDGDNNEVVANRRAEIDSDQSDEQIGSTVKYDNDEDVENNYEEEEGGGVDNDKRSSLMKEAGDIDGEEDKEKQQSAVPTGGPFYMHDDRFQEISSGGNRRMRGGRKSWGSGEERKWGHDKFEEMNTREKHYDQKTSRGRRSHGRGRGQERGYTRGSSSNASSSNGQQIYLPKAIARGSSSNTLSSNGQQIYLPKAVARGKGRKFETSQRNGNQAHSEQSKQLRNSPIAPKTGNEGARAKKNVAASSLSSASPPFYPSVPSSNLVPGIQVGMERLHMNESTVTSGKKYRNTKPGFSPVYIAKTIQSTSQGGGAPAAGNVFYPQSHSQGDRFSSPMQHNGDSNGTHQTGIRSSGQGFDQHSAVIRSLSSSPQKSSSSRNRYFSGEKEFASETGASITKGKGTLQPSGSGSFLYSGSQVMGRAESLASGDNSNFAAFLPGMQFGGQHGGVPTFGMAYPGYVQPEHGVGNPEMAWMPVFTGPGALGASYSPPYAANQAHKPRLPSSAESSSKENSTNNLNDLEKPMERPGVTESGVSQGQNNNPRKQPRRYSEMSFTK